jgi:aspartate oxidase
VRHQSPEVAVVRAGAAGLYTSVRRIVHAGGAATGRRLVRQLSAVAAEEPGIDVVEGRRVVELLVADEHCIGVRLDDGHLIAISGLARTESRGAHQRRDFPDRDPDFDGRHVTISAGSEPVIDRWM